MWSYNYTDELYHHGVKGMKWGVRRKRAALITVAKANRNANERANDAYKKSLAESKNSGDKGVGSYRRAKQKASEAKRAAYKESIKNDKAYNKQLKADYKKNHPLKRRDVVKKGGAIVSGLLVGSMSGKAAASITGSPLIGIGVEAVSTVMTYNEVLTRTGYRNN